MPVGVYPRPPKDVQFWRKVNKTDGCWEWTGARGPKGYGHFNAGPGRTSLLATRFVWELVHGVSPGELCVLHRCDNPPCVRPDHLFLGTRADNAADMIRKGRKPPVNVPPLERRAWGERHGRSKLTAEDVREIRRLLVHHKQKDVAVMFGVHRATVGDIATGKKWRHLC